jgi:large subunit ribosomal protein L21
VYAIIEDRGSQYQVREGDRLEIQLQNLSGEAEQIVFDRVLMVGEGADARIGQPYLADAKVTASILGGIKGDKITIIKMKRRKNYRRKQGHRQRYLQIRIDKIEA